jgi:hypothetical protein
MSSMAVSCIIEESLVNIIPALGSDLADLCL